MKFREIRVERFGVWRDLRLPQLRSGVNVFYGPNEAGKSTLLDFIRGVLYGFPPRRNSQRPALNSTEEFRGEIEILAGDAIHEIVRHGDGRGHDSLRVTGTEQEDDGDEKSKDEHLRDLLHGTNGTIFENVFAIGLQELQELGTLDDEQVARHLYGLTLGPEVQRLLEITEEAERRRRLLYDDSTSDGRIAQLHRHYEELSEEIAQTESRRSQHALHVDERRRLENRSDEFRKERTELHRQLRGHLFLERVHPPWEQARKLRADLLKTPELTDFPEHGLQQLDAIEEEIDSAVRCRDALRSEITEIQEESREIESATALRKHAGAVRSLVESRDWIVGLERAVAQGTVEIEDAETSLQDATEQLGPGWNAERLERTAVPGNWMSELLESGRRYQAALVRRGRLRKRRRQLSSAVQRRTVEVQQNLAAHGGDTIESGLQAARKRLADLEDLERLELRLEEFERRRNGMELERGRLEDRPDVPRWVNIVLAFFGLTGIGFLILGIITGTGTGIVAGAAYALLGLTCGGIAWALKSHFEGETAERLEDLHSGARENDERIREIRGVIARIEQEESSPAPRPQATVDVENRLAEQRRKIAELERIAQRSAKTSKLRERLTDLRGRHRQAIRDLSSARQAWCEILRRAGLTETVELEAGFEAAKHLIAAREALASLRAAERSIERDRSTLDELRERMERTGKKIGRWNPQTSLGDILVGWSEALDDLRRQRAERRRLRHAMRKRRKETREYARRIEAARARRQAILVRGGAENREEFDERAELVTRRKELEELLELAEEDLAVAIRTEPELAIVEDDLTSYDADRNQQRVAALNGQLQHLEDESDAVQQELGAVKQAIHALAADRSASRLRLEREQTATSLREAIEEWAGFRLASQVLARMCHEHERSHQPVALRIASRYLEALTDGRLCTIWSPLGRRELCVDDTEGRSLTTDELSGGTREQLFLALRLAVAERLADEGVSLPMILDDVFVNFDRQRAEAAVRTLIEFAGTERQVLIFTCHEHLASLFAQHGIEPVGLPEHAGLSDRRRAG